MKAQQIEQINAKYGQSYQISNSGRIFTMFMGEKFWHKFDEVIARWDNFEKVRIAEENVKVTSLFIEQNGGECFYKSCYGSRYYDYNGYKVRISDHHWTSEKHRGCDINLCSYNAKGYIEMIEKLKSL